MRAIILFLATRKGVKMNDREFILRFKFFLLNVMCWQFRKNVDIQQENCVFSFQIYRQIAAKMSDQWKENAPLCL